MREMAAQAGTMTGVDASAEQLDLLREADGRLPTDIFRRMRENADRGVGRPAGAGNRKTKELAKLIVHKYGDPVEAMASIYSKPLDQLCEMLMIADGTRVREERLAADLDQLSNLVEMALADARKRGMSDERIDALTKLLGKIEDDFRVLKAKPGELGLKAMIMQRDAAREVAQYVHSKMPVAVDVTLRPDVILNIPGLTDPAALQDFVNAPELTQEALEALEYTPFEVVEEGE
jgi:hypothetical protein